MNGDDQQKLNLKDVDNRRRLSEIKLELQGLMRQKKKYDEDKLKQDADFLQSEIQDLRNLISDLNKDIKHQSQTKMKLQIEMTNLRSRSRIRWTNLTSALRDKRRFEAELKKENKTEEYRDLARREIQSIDAAIPTLKKEEDYKRLLIEAEDAQQTATNKRKKLEESLNKNLRKQTEIKQLLGENAGKVPQIEATIENLRSERERLLSSSSTNTKKSRRRPSSIQLKLLDSPSIDSQTLASLEEDCFDNEKHQSEDQLNKVKILLQYFREKLTEHGLEYQRFPSTPSSELTSPLYHPITPYEEQTILSSYMDDKDLNSTTTNNESTKTIAMKLPRNFLPLDLNSTTNNEIIHSPFYNGNEIEYKKELSADIVDKYGGQQNKSKQYHQQLSNQGKKYKKNKKNFAITHNTQMIALYNQIRSSTDSSDTLPSMPMYEYELYSTIQSLESFQQSLESYLTELTNRVTKLSLVDDDDIRDSALDTVSETSSLIEPFKENSIDEKKLFVSTLNSNRMKKNCSCLLASVDENHSNLLINPNYHNQIDRQISDEGYRSVQNDQQQIPNLITNHTSPLLTRSKSYDSTDKVDQWLINTTAKSLPQTISSNQDFKS